MRSVLRVLVIAAATIGLAVSAEASSVTSYLAARINGAILAKLLHKKTPPAAPTTTGSSTAGSITIGATGTIAITGGTMMGDITTSSTTVNSIWVTNQRLSTSNTYTGGTTISGGTLKLSGAPGLMSGGMTSGSITVSNAAFYDGAGLTTASGPTVSFPTSNSYTGSTNISGGILQLSGAGTLMNGGTVTGSNSISNTVTTFSTAGLTNTGFGTLTLSASNSFLTVNVGGLNVSGGTLQLGGTQLISTGLVPLTINGSAGGLLGGANSFSQLVMAARNTTAPVGPFPVNSLNAQGAVIIGGGNSYTGLTNVNSGILTLSNIFPGSVANGGILVGTPSINNTLHFVKVGSADYISSNSLSAFPSSLGGGGIVSTVPEPTALTLAACGFAVLSASCLRRLFANCGALGRS